MPYRRIRIVPGEIYHVFNRSIAKQPIFLSINDYQRALEVFQFYQHDKPPLRFSFYNRLPAEERRKFLSELKSSKILVEIICFCIMPNHVHFLLKNLEEGGIKQFMSNFQNSYAKYFNTRHNRTGSLFQSMFKAVRIESEEQLIHVSRYIHLNPVTSYLIEMAQLKNYSWSSYMNYLNKDKTYIKKELIFSLFRSVREYEKFVADQVSYQRQLDKIKHLILE